MPGVNPLTTRERRFRTRLLQWYGVHRRALPWRETRDPYRILVSEIMLQQTQAARVVPAYERFVATFPTAHALASAAAADVLTAWRGLGYNRRAMSLHAAARAITERHGGSVPADLDALRALPGVGEYTARAVLAFAFDREVAPVDTNVARVLLRAVMGEVVTKAALQQAADRLAVGAGGAWSHALMDLGARMCTAAGPACESCPARGVCAWRSAGGDAADPAAASPVRPRPQGRFAGSARFHRGRLVDALRDGPVPAARLPQAAELVDDPERAAAVAEQLVRDGLAEWEGDRLALPGRRGDTARA